jgi:putative glutamine amidotransferase
LSKVKVGISAGLMIDPVIRFENYWKVCLNEDYVTSVLKAGGAPIVIPIVDDEEVIRAQVENLDAIIFSGGVDINPEEYGEKLSEKTIEIDKKRDWFDLKLAKLAKELKIPTLCICRGHQIATVLDGGTLYQDLSYAKNITFEHDQYSTPAFLAHEIKIAKGSLLYDILGKDKLKVNSFHHQIVKDMPKGFKVSAVSTDGAIEAFEYKDAQYFFLSVQWHPEMMAACDDENMLKIFRRLIKEAQI